MAPFREEAMQFVNGKSVRWIDTPKLLNIRWSTGLKWVTELVMQDYSIPRLPDLACVVVNMANSNSQHVRPTKKGVAYYCPHMILPSRADFESAVPKPTVSMISGVQMIETIATRGKWAVSLSDKGAFQGTFLEKVGGLEAAASVLRDPPSWAILKAYLSVENDREAIFLRAESDELS